MKLHRWYSALCLCVLIGACRPAQDTHPLCLHFESDADLDRLQWHCKTMYARSREHATEGEFSLRIDFYPSEYPRFEPLLRQQDWTIYSKLYFDVYNPHEQAVAVTLRIDDDITRPDFYDCYIEYIRLQPGHNSIIVELKNLIGCSTKRLLRRHAIRKFLLFMTRPRHQYTLFLDNFCLR